MIWAQKTCVSSKYRLKNMGFLNLENLLKNMFESIELLNDTSCVSSYHMNSVVKTLPLILSSGTSSLRWQTYFSASELKKSGLAPYDDVYGVRARLWKRLGTSKDCTIRFGMAQVAGNLELFNEFVNVREMGRMSGVSVKDEGTLALQATRMGETVKSFRGRLRRAFWPNLKDEDIEVVSPRGNVMKDPDTLPASVARRTSPLYDGIRNLEWIVRVIENSGSKRRVRLQDTHLTSPLVPNLNVSELVLFEESDEERKLTWDGKSGIVLEICVDGSMTGVSGGGVYVKNHPEHSVRSVYLADGVKGM